MRKIVFTKVIFALTLFLLGSFATLGYFLYRSKVKFIPHLSELTGMQDVGMLEVFEWPLDILFPAVPIFVLCLCYLATKWAIEWRKKCSKN